MTDRELLEKAAKAAGITNYSYCEPVDGCAALYVFGGVGVWDPLTEDGDALRLAVHLHLEIDHNHPLDNDAWVMATPNGQMVGPTEEVDGEENRCAATRRCITRAAAAIGEGKT